MSNAAGNPAVLAGLPQGWTVQNTESDGGGDQSLVDGGSAPTSGIGGGGAAKNGLLAWTFDPLFTTTGGSPATGTQIASKIFWPGGNMTNLWIYCTSHATTQTHGWLAVYDGSGTQWAATADLGSTALTTSPAANSVPLSAVTPVPSGWYYIYAAFIFSAGTYTFNKFSGTTSANKDVNISAAPYVFNYDLTTVTALPASLTWGTGWTTDASTYLTWFGVN